MNGMIAHLRHSVTKYLAYRRTAAELQKLDLDTALDLDIYRPDARRIARRAVYGA
jgi:uncharacterized protein YjiS (DUF1127 family)